MLLRLLVSIMCRENQHSAETILQSSFGSYINREYVNPSSSIAPVTHLLSESSAAPLQLVYDMFTSAHTDTARRVLGEKVCVHMMRECNEPTLVEFCCSNISSIMATIEERIARVRVYIIISRVTSHTTCYRVLLYKLNCCLNCAVSSLLK